MLVLDEAECRILYLCRVELCRQPLTFSVSANFNSFELSFGRRSAAVAPGAGAARKIMRQIAALDVSAPS